MSNQETQALSPIQQAVALAAAQQQAAAAAAAASPVSSAVALATEAQSGSNVSTVVAGPKLSMNDVTGSSMSVDMWIKPNEAGLRVGDDKTLFHGLRCSISMVDGSGFIIKFGIKAGNPAQYAYTTDNATCITGGSWADACAKIRALEPSKAVTPYRAVDLPFTVLEDFCVDEIDPKTKTVVSRKLIDAGKVLGYTTSTTNWKNWEIFYNEVASKGWLGQTVVVELDAAERSNKAGNIWGVMTFKLIDLLENLQGE